MKSFRRIKAEIRKLREETKAIEELTRLVAGELELAKVELAAAIVRRKKLQSGLAAHLTREELLRHGREGLAFLLALESRVESERPPRRVETPPDAARPPMLN